MPEITPLFRPLSAEAVQRLETFPRLLDGVFPLSPKHRAALHRDVQSLSDALTSERGDDLPDYFAHPNWISAYLRWFLPWNLIRLSTLFASLDFPAPTGQVLDLGAGPATLALAAHIARPDWRDKAISWILLDKKIKPLHLGRDLLRAAVGPDSPWKAFLVKEPIEKARGAVRGDFALLACANALNERLEGIPDPESTLDRLLGPLWNRAGLHCLFVEPGTRLGGKAVSTVRDLALEAGFHPVSPCPHSGPCPLPRNTWCHFAVDAGVAPKWLKDLAAKARLTKSEAQLAFFFGAREEPHRRERSARAVSHPMRIPRDSGFVMGLYACSAEGLLLVESNILKQGDGFTYRLKEGRDPKSKALLAEVDAG